MQARRNHALIIIMWLLALGWAAVLFVFSGQNGVKSGELSQRFTHWLLRLFPSLPWSAWELEPILRKIAHFGIFAVEGFLLGVAMQLSLRARLWGALLSIAACAAVAGLNEFHQSFVAGRNAAFTDVLIDSAGATAGILFACLLMFIVRRAAVRRRRNVII